MAILYSCLFLVFGYFIVIDLNKNGWTISSYFSIYFAIFYALAPAVFYFHADESDVLKQIVYNKGLALETDIAVISFLMICAFFVAFRIVYSKVNPSDAPLTKIQTNFKYIGNTETVVYLTVFLSLLSFISLVLYVRGFGSLDAAMLSAKAVRSGVYKDSNLPGSTSYTFFKRFIFLAIIPFMAYFSFIVRTKMARNIFVIGLSLVLPVITLGVFYLLLNQGRQVLIDFALIFVFAGLIKTRKVISTKIIIVGLLAIPLLSILSGLFSYNNLDDLRENLFKVEESDSNHFLVFINEFIFPYTSLVYALTYDYSSWFFADYYYGLYGSLLPATTGEGKQIVFTNTFYAINQYRAIVPPGIVASGVYNLGAIGVVITGAFFAFVFGHIDKFFKRLDGYEFYTIYAFVIIKTLTLVRTAVPAYFFYDTVMLSLLIFLAMSFHFVKGNKPVNLK